MEYEVCSYHLIGDPVCLTDRHEKKRVFLQLLPSQFNDYLSVIGEGAPFAFFPSSREDRVVSSVKSGVAPAAIWVFQFSFPLRSVGSCF